MSIARDVIGNKAAFDGSGNVPERQTLYCAGHEGHPMSSKGARKSGRPTIHDVAAAVGVSAITVSRALRTPGVVSAGVRRRIAAAIDRLGYVQNRIAGNLSAGTSTTVAVIVPNMRNAFFATMIDTLCEVLEPARFQILVASSRYDAQAERRLVESLLGWRPAAIVLVGTGRTREARTALRRSGVLVIETWDIGGKPVDATIGFSHQAVGHAIGVHLLERGYRAIAFIGAAMDKDLRAAARYEGFRAALAAQRREPVAMVALAEWASVAAGGRGLRDLLARAPAADAVFCSNDTLALGALFECQRRGVRVPHDLAIAGFGDLDASACCVPALTTVRPPGEEIGRRAASLILARAGRSAAGATRRATTVDLGFTLVPRESTATRDRAVTRTPKPRGARRRVAA
jgi:LacI family gluconate utilization system Gnt-I transcriptional repressor